MGVLSPFDRADDRPSYDAWADAIRIAINAEHELTSPVGSRPAHVEHGSAGQMDNLLHGSSIAASGD